MKPPTVHLFLFRVDCDEIVICDEVAASSADDLKKAKKVNVSIFDDISRWFMLLRCLNLEKKA